ncbi:MAG: SGNH/GDSL hydrolase family protein [Myxococcota bacterium]
MLGSTSALAISTLNQFQSVTVAPQSGGSGKPTWRHAVYGDSIFAGYVAGGGLFGLPGQTRRNAAYVESEYLANKWNVNIDHQGRCVSGAVASQIFSRMQTDVSYMQASNTRIVSFEMCGNDFLQARSTFRGASGCDETVIQNALTTCKSYMAQAMDYINSKAPAGTVKMVMNIYYPGFDADRTTTKSGCGGRTNMDVFLPYLAKSNWAACDLARQKGFLCGDSFADFMAADYDRNGDGTIDSQALRYVPGESESSYVTRISQTLKGTLVDSNGKLLSASTSVDYLQKDDTHPTYTTTNFSAADTWGHNRAGASLARNNSSF